MRIASINLSLSLLALSACVMHPMDRVVLPSIPAAGTNPTEQPPYSAAVWAGDVLYLAGNLGIDPATGQPPGDPLQEAVFLLNRFEATLTRAGLTMDDLVQVQVFCSDLSQYGAFNKEYRSRFKGTDYPARAFIGAGPLLRGARYEIMGVAVRH